ncbi:L-2-amino-thiazoline-4-carboxylic acid hydrolase [Lysinibacillus sp. KU-BSD001]|uniref:L-2-amino-thiazoline-4-carboxylic acid hydrolase n=1 Tax=Lysinibacillus sp. KU-BSD001 TaxID=3141328 RepID=UPI0036E65000
MTELAMKNLSMDMISAKMFTCLDKEITVKYGEEGKTYLVEGLTRFGLKDAEAMAKKATAEGENHTFFQYLPKQIEGVEQYAHLTDFARFAKMFAQIAKVVVDIHGDEGKQVISEAVRKFGESRGQGIAQRARANGFDNDIDNYLKHYDMGRSDLFHYESYFTSDNIEQTFFHCPLGQQWADDNMHEYGILYCQMIDPAIASGYNEKFEVEHDQYVLKEGVCHFNFKMKE